MEIKVLGICGSPVRGGNTEVFLREALKESGGVADVETEFVSLAGKEIKDCRHCNWCIKKQEIGKFCAQQDDMTDIYPKVLQADAILLASPAYIGRMSGYMACFTDRLRAFTFGNVYRGKLENKVGGALAVGWLRHGGLETTLLTLVYVFMGFGMIPVSPPHGLGAPYGAVGLSSKDGTGSFDPKDRLGVLQDEPGLKGARALGKRVAEISGIFKAVELR